MAGAPCPSDLSWEGSARRRGAGRRRRRSRDEEEQDGAEVVVADAPLSHRWSPLRRQIHGPSPDVGGEGVAHRWRREAGAWRLTEVGQSTNYLVVMVHHTNSVTDTALPIFIG